MLAYNDNPTATGSYVWITADTTTGRRSRASAISAARRAYERAHGVTLSLLAKSYSETPGFMARSSFRYRIRRLTPATVRTYRRVRAAGWTAADAYRFAVDDARLTAAENNGLIWFTREPDYDFRPADMSDIPEIIEYETKGLSDGSLELFGIVAHTPTDPDHAASLWGIVVPVDDWIYPRYIEIELASEASVI